MPEKTLKEKVDAIRKRIRTSKYYAERERSHYQLETWRQTEEVLTALEERVEELEKERDRPRPPIICLCGSTRFMDAFFEAGWQFTLGGYIVLSVGVCKHVDTEGGHGAEMLGQDVADKLDELHLRKIDLADEVCVLNVGGYIGESTRKEIEYAKSLNKPIMYLEAPSDDE